MTGRPKTDSRLSQNPTRELRVTRLDDIEMQAADWLWEQDGNLWVPLRSLVLLGGRESTGKSTWTARLIAKVTTGTLPGEYYGTPKSVIISAAEDSWEVTILPRLVAAGADLGRIFRVDAEESGHACGLTLPTDVAALTDIVGLENVVLIVLDPLLGTISSDLNTYKDSDVRRALAPITALAHQTRCTVIGLIHENKSQSQDMITRLMGSRAFAAVARVVLVCAEVERDEVAEALDGSSAPRSFLLGQLKNNLGPKVETSVRYELHGETVGTDPHTAKAIRTSRVHVIDELDPRSVEEASKDRERAREERADGRRVTKGETTTDQCRALLDELLADGPVDGSVLKALAAKAGFVGGTYLRAVGGLVRTGTQNKPVYARAEEQLAP